MLIGEYIDMIGKYGLAYRAYKQWEQKNLLELGKLLNHEEFFHARFAKRDEIVKQYKCDLDEFKKYEDVAYERLNAKLDLFELEVAEIRKNRMITNVDKK